MDETARTLGEYDRYIDSLFAEEDNVLRLAREETEHEGLPLIHVSASEGKLLHVLALGVRARRILEIGTLGGYSAIWLARALPPDGTMVSLELQPHHARVARRNLERAGLADRVDVREGPAVESLARIREAGEEAFDLVFIDADKDRYVDYLGMTVPLVRDGGLILADNTLNASVLDPEAQTGAKRYNAASAARTDLVTVVAPVLRTDGIDGLSISVKVGSRPSAS